LTSWGRADEPNQKDIPEHCRPENLQEVNRQIEEPVQDLFHRKGLFLVQQYFTFGILLLGAQEVPLQLSIPRYDFSPFHQDYHRCCDVVEKIPFEILSLTIRPKKDSA
jgi:hypothetical protein